MTQTPDPDARLAGLTRTYNVGTLMSGLRFVWDVDKESVNRRERQRHPSGRDTAGGTDMRREYDFSGARQNPYAAQLKRSVTIRLDERTIDYFKRLSTELDIPYQTLINLYLRDCAATRRRLSMQWRPSKGRG